MIPGRFRVVLDPAVRRVADGSVLVGGSPLRVLRLTPPGRQLVDRLANGDPVPRSEAAQTLTRRLLDAGIAHPRPPAPLPSTTPASAGDVAVVIPVHDDAGGLAATLTAPGLRTGTSTVVVDDGSREPTAVAGVCARHQARLIRRAHRRGPAAARNAGWRATAAPFVAFVDANCEPDRGWLDVLLPHFADPAVAAVAPRIAPAAQAPTPGWLAAYEAVASPLDRGRQEAIVRPGSAVPYVPTAALVVRRRALEALGGFDEDLTVGEDVDFVWRLAASGWTVRYEPAAVVRHPIRAGWLAWLTQRYRYGTSAAALARRHGAAVAPAVVAPSTAAAWGLVASGRLRLAAGLAGCSAVALAGRLWRSDAVPLPGGEAVRLAALRHVRGGLTLARAVRRTWSPAAVLLAVASRRSRPALAAAVVVPGVVDWFRKRPALDPVRFVTLGPVDDLAYAAGVWAGCLRERSGRALLPDIVRTQPRSIGGRS